jgi:subtilisin family serine protease
MRLRAAFLILFVGGALFLGAAPAAAEEGVVVGAGAPDAIAGRYLVVLNETPTRAEAEALAERYGGRLDRAFSVALPGFAASMDAASARKLAAHPAVESVQQDRRVSALGQQTSPPSWGLDRIDQPDLPLSGGYTYPSLASAVRVYVLDTGILVGHTDFGGRAVHGFDFVSNDGDASDCHGHGTHVAGTVGGAAHGVAKGVQLVAVRVLDCTGVGSYTGIISAIDWITATAPRPAVVNMSLGGSASTLVDNAVRASIAAGVTFALAAGNSAGDACAVSPARTSEALTVGATDSTDARASFSNFGSCVDIFAPGVSIRSAYHTGTSVTADMNGTSMATPHVAGAASLFLAANPTATPAQVAGGLAAAGRSGVVGNPGTGSANLLLQVGNWPAVDPGPVTPPVITPPVVIPPPPPAPAPLPCWVGHNGQNMTLRDKRTIASPIRIGGCPGRPTKAVVDVHIVHSRRGDVVVELIAPNGSVKRLKKANSRDRGANVHAWYSTKINVKSRNGVWKLRVRDQYRGHTGYLDSWTIAL